LLVKLQLGYTRKLAKIRKILGATSFPDLAKGAFFGELVVG
jgi:hypothetical protein